MKKKSLIVRIIAIVMCALLLLGVISAAISAFGYDVNSTLPATGSSSKTVWIAVIGLVAVVIAAACVIISKKKK